MSRFRLLVMILLVLFSACKAPSSWRRSSTKPSESLETPETQLHDDNPAIPNKPLPVENSVDQQPLEPSLTDAMSGLQISPNHTESSNAAILAASQSPPSAPIDSDWNNAGSANPTSSNSDRVETVQQVDGAQPTETDTIAGVIPSSSVENAETLVRFSITGVQREQGTIKIALYTDEHSFNAMKNASQSLKLSPSQSKLEFTQPMSGRFAAAVYQDINGDGELNRNRFGIPTEPFAFSNNAMGVRGPPTFEQAAVVVPERCDEVFEVNIKLPLTQHR